MALFKKQDRFATGSAPPADTAGAVAPSSVTPAKVAKRSYAKAVGGGSKRMSKRMSKRSGR